MNYKKVLDSIAEIEHQQWEYWSKEIARDLKRWQEYSNIITIKVGIERRLMRLEKFWKPFNKLSKEAKDQDREWAEKVIPLVPNRCPINQCGGFMFCKERKPPEKDMEEYNGDWQTPDLVCSDCGAIYSFQRFKKGK